MEGVEGRGGCRGAWRGTEGVEGCGGCRGACRGMEGVEGRGGVCSESHQSASRT